MKRFAASVVSILRLIYRPAALADIAVKSISTTAASSFVLGIGPPAALIVAFGGAAVGEPYPTLSSYYAEVLRSLVVFGLIGALAYGGIPLALFWLVALVTNPKIAALGRTLLHSPLTVFVPLMAFVILVGVTAPNDPDFGLWAEPKPAWMMSPIVVAAGSVYVLGGIFLFWLLIVSFAFRRMLKMDMISRTSP